MKISVSKETLQRCCDRYNATRSLDPHDYTDLCGDSAEYVVSLLSAYLGSKRTPPCASPESN